MKNNRLVFKIMIIAFIIIPVMIFANDIVPGKKQAGPIALTGATIHTVSNGDIQNGILVFDNGKIISVGDANSPIPQDAKVINIEGKHVYPGLIASYTGLGLVEISAVRATRDASEIGDINPNVKVSIAYNTDSELIPTIRSNGITTALVVPSGGIISGISSVMMLDGWTAEETELKGSAGIHLNWPNMKIRTRGQTTKKIKEMKETIQKNIKKLHDAFFDARQYFKTRNNKNRKIDLRWEAMIPLFEREIPLFVYANEYKQIEAAIDFCKQENLKMILVGGADSWMLTDILKEYNIPVIVRRVHSLPTREDEGYDLPYKLPKILFDAGIKFCLSNTGFWGVYDVRNLPFLVSTAVAFGLDKDTALRSVTLSSAEILGVDKQIGSIDVGKDATIIVSTGDVLDMSSNNIEYEFIQGRQVDLDDRHKQLHRKYLQKYQ